MGAAKNDGEHTDRCAVFMDIRPYGQQRTSTTTDMHGTAVCIENVWNDLGTPSLTCIVQGERKM